MFMQNKKLFFLSGGVIVLFLGMTIYILFSPKPSANTGKLVPVPTLYPTAYPKIIKKFDPSQLSLTPDESVRLLPEQKQTFRISFPSSTDTRYFTMQLTQAVVPEETTSVAPITIVRDTDTNTFIVTMLSPVVSSTVYRLNIVNSQTNDIIYQAKYISQDLLPTPIPTNNEALKQYLPYETNQFLLSYNTSRNVYVFNLKIVVNDPSDLENQFQKAKEAAEAFIQSKGVDPASLVIEWRRS